MPSMNAIGRRPMRALGCWACCCSSNSQILPLFNLARDGRRTMLPYFSQQLIIAVEFDKLPYSADRVKVEVEVMQRVQHRRQNFICHKQMTEIGPRIRPANGTRAVGIYRIGILLIP